MQALEFDVTAGVATLTLNRPERRNAIDLEMRAELAECVDAVRRDSTVRALVITGAGGAFCAGGDLRLISGAGLDGEGWRKRMQDAHIWVRTLIELDRPVIAAVDGPAFGAGFSLALTADFVLATPRARFSMSFVKVGGVPDFGALYTLPRVVGAHRARELMLSGREVAADEAQVLGIVAEIHPSEALAARARAIAESFVGAPPVAVSLVKRALSGGPGANLDTMLDYEAMAQALAFGTEYHCEAVRRFLSREPAMFAWPQADT